MKIKSQYKIREMAGEHVIVLPGRLGADMTRVISLNDSSLFLWQELADKEFSEEDAAQLLIEHYEIEDSIAQKDASAWCRQLLETGMAE